jgi:hypothetical protein
LRQKHAEAWRVKAKQKEAGTQHPERDAQVRSRDSPNQGLMAGGKPIIRVDTKNKGTVDA